MKFLALTLGLVTLNIQAVSASCEAKLKDLAQGISDNTSVYQTYTRDSMDAVKLISDRGELLQKTPSEAIGKNGQEFMKEGEDASHKLEANNKAAKLTAKKMEDTFKEYKSCSSGCDELIQEFEAKLKTIEDNIGVYYKKNQEVVTFITNKGKDMDRRKNESIGTLGDELVASATQRQSVIAKAGQGLAFTNLNLTAIVLQLRSCR